METGISLFERLKTATTSQTSLYGASGNKGEERRVRQRYISDIVRGPLSSALHFQYRTPHLPFVVSRRSAGARWDETSPMVNPKVSHMAY